MKIHFTAEEFRSIVSVGVASSTDEVTPIICATNISFSEQGEVTAIATDRYRVARVQFTPLKLGEADVSRGEDSVTINTKELAKFWATVKTDVMRGGFWITLETESFAGSTDMYTLSCASTGITVKGMEVYGNYPNVGKLMEGYGEDEATGVPSVGLNPNFLGDLVKMYHPRDFAKVNMKFISWNFRFKATAPEERSNKRNPVYITREAENGGATSARLDYLVQPSMLVR
tara:strand:- start:2168 stop:2857 length:690 start_codon:yes stop_codon:yes gene_type:complete